MLMIHVNVSPQISRDVFAYGEIIQMPTTYESYYTVIKLPRNGNRKAKKINKKYNSVYRSYQAQLMGWIHMTLFTQIIHSQIDTRKSRTKDILNFFQKGSVFGLHEYQL